MVQTSASLRRNGSTIVVLMCVGLLVVVMIGITNDTNDSTPSFFSFFSFARPDPSSARSFLAAVEDVGSPSFKLLKGRVLQSSECSNGLPGVEGGGICCQELCGACGGAGCGRRDGGVDNCCVGAITAAGEMCSRKGEAPCIVDDPIPVVPTDPPTDEDPPTDPPTLPPTDPPTFPPTDPPTLSPTELLMAPPFPTNFTDSRDSQLYEVLKIGNQMWMKENLNYQSSEALCYDNDSDNCETYGALYTWDDATANTHGNGQDICPSGWHLPTDEEWQTLEVHAGLTTSEADDEGWRGMESANTANNLKSTSGWRYKGVDGNGVDLYGFTILSGGRWRSGPQRYRHLGHHADFWTSTSVSTNIARNRKFTSGKPVDHSLYNGDNSWSIDRGTRPKNDGHSVRCVMD